MAFAVFARRWAFLVALLSLASSVGLAQEVSSDSFTFNQPVPVTIRMSNNNVLQAMLMGVNQTGVSVLTPQGKVAEFAHKKVKSVRSADGSIFFQPAKDDVGELITKLNTLMPNNKTATAAGQANAGSGPNATMPMPSAAHSQPSSTSTTTTMPAMQMAHSQPPTTSYTPPAHSSSSYSPPPYTPPPMPHMAAPPPSMTMPPAMPQMQQQLMWEYQCSKCRHKFTTTVQMTPGQSCPKCGTKWHYINGQGAANSQGAPLVKERPAILHPKVLGTIVGVVVVLAAAVLIGIKVANG